MNEKLARALTDPGYTPPQKAYAEVAAMLTDAALARRAEQALISAGSPAAAFAAARLAGAAPAEQPALVRIVGRALQQQRAPELLGALVHALSSPYSETRRQAAIALGKSGDRAAEAPLLECLASDDPKLLRSVIEALGKVGSVVAQEALTRFVPSARLEPVVTRALLMLERSLSREAQPVSAIALDRKLPHRQRCIAICRAGIATWLCEEAAQFAPVMASPTEVQFDHDGALRPLAMLRMALEIAIERRLSPGPSLVTQLQAALLDPSLAEVVLAWSNGPPRFRLEWQGQGHQRAASWAIAQALRAAKSPLENDPRGAAWSFRVTTLPYPRLLLVPASYPELRFAYRKRDVPGASHPTLAAALAWVAGARADDVVWDPFVGSGLELVERARLGPYRQLIGSDIARSALAAARENLQSAGIQRFELELEDARQMRVERLSLVISNPPMGRRVARQSGLSELLCAVVRQVAAQLSAYGRMVWLSPFPEATAAAARAAGLRVERLSRVDLGGFDAELQRFSAASDRPQRRSGQRG